MKNFIDSVTVFFEEARKNASTQSPKKKPKINIYGEGTDYTQDYKPAVSLKDIETQNNKYQGLSQSAKQQAMKNDYYTNREQILDTSKQQINRLGNKLSKLGQKVATDFVNAPIQAHDALKEYRDERIAKDLQEYSNQPFENSYGFKNGKFQQLSDEDKLKNQKQLAEFYSNRFNPLDGQNLSVQNAQKSQELSEEIYTDTSDAEKFALQVAEGTLNFGAHYLLGMATGGASTLGTMALQSGANKTFENLNNGYDIETSLGNGALTGLVSAMTEKLPVDNVTNILNSKLGQFSVMAIASQAMSEAMEEGLEYNFDYLLDKATLGSKEEYNLGDMFMSMAVGGASGGLMGGMANFVPIVKTHKSVNALKSDINTLEQFKANNVLSTEESAFIDTFINSANHVLSDYYKQSVVGDMFEYEDDKAPRFSAEQMQNNLYKFLQPQVDAETKINLEQQAVQDIMKQTNDMLDSNQTDIDVSQYNALDESAKKQVDKVAEYAKQLKAPVSFDTTIDSEGTYDPKTGRIVINPLSEKAMVSTLVRELTHSSENSKNYKPLKEFAIDYFNKTSEDGWNGYLNYLAEEVYPGLSLDALEQEAVAIAMQDNLSNEDFIQALAKYDNSLTARVFEEIKKLVSNGDNYSKEIEYNFKKAFHNKNKIMANGKNVEDVKHLIGRDNKGNKIAVIDKMLSKTDAQNIKLVKEFLNQYLGSKFKIEENGSSIYFKEYGVNEYLHSKYTQKLIKKNINKLIQKNRIILELGDVIAVAINPKFSKNHSNKIHQNNENIGQNGFVKYQTTFAIPIKGDKGKSLDYNVYNGDIVIEINKKGFASLYDIINIKKSSNRLDETSIDDEKSIYSVNINDAPGATFDNIITNNTSKVKLSNGKSADGDKNVFQRTETNDSVKYSKKIPTKQENLQKFDDALEKYGPIDHGSEPRKNVEVPKQTDDKTKVSQTARTIAEADAFKGEQLDDFKAEIGAGRFSYKPESNQDQIELAKKRLAQKTDEEALHDFLTGGRQDGSIVTGELLLRKLGETGDSDNAIRVASELARQLREAGRDLQSWSIIKRLTPEGRLISVKNQVNKIQNTLDVRYGQKAPNVTIPNDLQAKLLNAKTDAEINEALNEISKTVAKQIPSTFMDKMNAWRFLSMLGNPKTHIRNIVGNAIFKPVVDLKNYVGSGLESYAKNKGWIEHKTKTSLSSQDKELIEFAKADYKNTAESIIKKDGKYDITELINEHKDVFDGSKPWGKALNYLVKKNGDLLDIEDTFFSKQRYATSLAQFMKANNLTENDADSDLFKKGQQYAIDEALKATYRDDNAFADWINQLAKVNAFSKLAIDSILPFKKTPMNIVKRGLEYSPAGLLWTTTKGAMNLKQGKITANEFIDSFSSGLTGTGLALIGAYLASKGILRIADDDKDRKQRYDNELGEQDYSLVFPFGSYTIDWASPVIMPMAAGAEVYRQFAEKDGNILDNLYDSLTSIAEPIFETSMLSGLIDTIKTYSSADANIAFEMVSNGITSYILQYFPTIGGQMARILDDTQRTTYPNNGKIDRLFRRILNKLPGLSQKLQPVINKKGEEVKREDMGMGLIGRLLLELSPGYFKSNKQDETSQELNRLYNETGEMDAIPSNASNRLTYDGEKYKLLNKDYTDYQKNRYSLEDAYVKEFINSPMYGSLDDFGKAGIIGDIRDYASKKAKEEYLETQGIEYDDPSLNKVNNALENGLDVYEYYLLKDAKDSLHGKETKQNFTSILEGSDIPQQSKEYMYSLYYKGDYNEYVNRNDIKPSAKFETVYSEVFKNETKDANKTVKAQVKNTKAPETKTEIQKTTTVQKTVKKASKRRNKKAETRAILRNIAKNQKDTYKKIDNILQRYVYDKKHVDKAKVKVEFQKAGLNKLIKQYLNDHPYVDKGMFGM